ncbi:MAG: hypothetical protein JRH20_22935 [Deltaproteobacteria bacterium]|nr:hypothetical protein [Deltaproteobacteria bacterium]
MLPYCDDAMVVTKVLEQQRLTKTPFGLEQLARVAHGAPAGPGLVRAKGILLRELSSSGTHQTRLLRVLVRWPVLALAPKLGELLAVEKNARKRALLLQAYGPVAENVRVFLQALNAADARVRLAAIEGLGRSPHPTIGVGYRLAKLGYREGPRFRGAATLSLARIGHPRFDRDLAFLIARLSVSDKMALLAKLRKTKKWSIAAKALRRGKTSTTLLARLDADTNKEAQVASKAAKPSERQAKKLHRLLLALTTP